MDVYVPKEENTYNVEVKCGNCGAKWYASIKKGTLVSEHACYNCGKTMLSPVK